MLDARFFAVIFWPKLKHIAARIACDSGPTCYIFTNDVEVDNCKI